jgi:GTP-binding protein
MSLFQNATYVASAHRLQDLPPPGAPEIAFAGRSNAGKSSAINALANRTRLAFVSKTPGRTQTINLFRLTGGGILANLPGYGYAKVPGRCASAEATLSAYLRQGKPLGRARDGRASLTERDKLIVVQPAGRPIHVLLTKRTSSLGARPPRHSRACADASITRGNTSSYSQCRPHHREAEAVFARWLGTTPGEAIKAPGQRKAGAKRLK